jgi:hypothetical protein
MEDNRLRYRGKEHECCNRKALKSAWGYVLVHAT